MTVKVPYPLDNRLDRGYGVATPDIDPASRQWNGRLIDMRGQRIHFWIEDIEASFAMGGTTAQSRTLRQFFPHNMVQPSVTVRGRAPNSFQYNRLASFVRRAQSDVVSAKELGRNGINLRTRGLQGGGDSVVSTVELTVRAGITSKYPFSGRTVKGRHKAWKLEGYIKSMPAGGQRFNQAPAFQFEFLIAESELSQSANIGIWSDTAVQGNQILPWITIFKSRGKEGFVQPKGQVPPNTNTGDVGGPYNGASPGIG